jgi:cell division protein FtsZ
MSLLEANDAAKYIYEVADPDAQIIFGAGIDDTLDDVIKVTVIATGFDNRNPVAAGANKGKGKLVDGLLRPTELKPIQLEDLDLPTFLRRDSGANGANNK